MRSLITDPRQVTETRYRRFLQRAQLRGFLADHLVRGEPYLALNAIILHPDDAALLGNLTATFARAFDRAARSIVTNVSLLVELGFPWTAAELLAAEQPRTPLVGRFDFVRDVDGHWWLLEYNADTPSGIREAIVVDRLVQEIAPAAARFDRPSRGLDVAMIRAFVAATRDLPEGSGLGLATDLAELEDTCQMAFTRELLRRPLEELGVTVTLGDVNNLRSSRDGLRMADRRIGALYRYVAIESIFGSAPFATIFDAAARRRVRLLNGLYGLLLQHKGLTGWLWQHRDDPSIPSDERVAIKNHLPPTYPLSEYAFQSAATPTVVKQVFGREGEEIYFGEELAAERWSALQRDGTYIVQQRVAVDEIDAVIQTSIGPTVARGHATVGSFAVDGQPAGFYSRFGTKIITSRAKWLATLVDVQS